MARRGFEPAHIFPLRTLHRHVDSSIVVVICFEFLLAAVVVEIACNEKREVQKSHRRSFHKFIRALILLLILFIVITRWTETLYFLWLGIDHHNSLVSKDLSVKFFCFIHFLFYFRKTCLVFTLQCVPLGAVNHPSTHMCFDCRHWIIYIFAGDKVSKIFQ